VTERPPDRERAGAHLVPAEGVEEGFVVLPYTKDEFKDFIRSLLGSPQAISKSLRGGFEIGVSDLRNLHQLISQRLRQQNEAALVGFLARIQFDDRSSVELSSIEEVLTYNEVRAVVSTAVHIRWDWLVKFQDKHTPEKQRIDVSFVSSDGDSPDEEVVFEIGPALRSIRQGRITFRIEHTARTWGADIEALLTGHLETLLRAEPRVRAVLHAYNGTFSFVAALLFLAGSVAGALVATRTFATERVAALRADLKVVAGADIGALNAKLDRVAEFVAGGAWPLYYFGLGVFLLAAIAGAIGVAIWIGSALSVSPPSFVLVTKEASKHRARVLARLERKWRSFLAAIVLSLVTGVVGNWIFRLIFE
jgi:hypothetical protein